MHGFVRSMHACMQVVQMLLTKVGGRYSTELGLNVDAGDEEVEKWFLTVTLFHRHLTFDVLKTTFQVGHPEVIALCTVTISFSRLFSVPKYNCYKH
jgi:hypothetical protein